MAGSTHTSQEETPGSSTPRYDASIYSTPFSSLPNPKRVWLGEPGSALEGIGSCFVPYPSKIRGLTDLGRLSLLTEDVVAAAAAGEIKTGRRVGLGWDMTKLEHSQFGRQSCQHRVIPLNGPDETGLGTCFDDVYEMNPRRLFLKFASLGFCANSVSGVNMKFAEQSSQWDGFRHYSQPKNSGDSSLSRDRVFYGGTTKEEILDSSNHRIGIHHWSSQGIAGIAVAYLLFI